MLLSQEIPPSVGNVASVILLTAPFILFLSIEEMGLLWGGVGILDLHHWMNDWHVAALPWGRSCTSSQWKDWTKSAASQYVASFHVPYVVYEEFEIPWNHRFLFWPTVHFNQAEMFYPERTWVSSNL